jgi:hypothetical protein
MKDTTPEAATLPGIVEDAWEKVAVSFERFCFVAGIATLSTMKKPDVAAMCALRHGCGASRLGRSRSERVDRLP